MDLTEIEIATGELNGLLRLDDAMSDELAKTVRTAVLALRQFTPLVRGLRQMMYGDTEWTGETGREVWNPDMEVNGGDLVGWVSEEMRWLGLVPKAGPRE